MTKVYEGNPATKEVTVQKGRGKKRKLKGGPYAWGDVKPITADHAAGCTKLAEALLLDVIDSEVRAKALVQRFKHRAITTANAAMPLYLTEDAILTVVAQIDKAAAEAAQSVTMAKQEVGPIGVEGGPDIVWTKTPKITQNHPPLKKGGE